MTDQWAQTLLSVGIPTVTVHVGILINNSRISDLRDTMSGRFDDVNRRFDDMNRRVDDVRDALRAEMLRVEGVMGARLRHLEDRQR